MLKVNSVEMSPQIALSHAILLIPLFMTGNVVGYSKTK
jgi:hypothetical protein